MFPKLLDLSWLPTSKFSFYGELPTLTFWECKPSSAWRSVTLLDEVLPDNLTYCKAWLTLPWHKLPRDETEEGKSQPRALADAGLRMPSLNSVVSQSCFHHSGVEVRNVALRSHILWLAPQTEVGGRLFLPCTPQIEFVKHYDEIVQAKRGTLPLQKLWEKAELLPDSRGDGSLFRGKKRLILESLDLHIIS